MARRLYASPARIGRVLNFASTPRTPCRDELEDYASLAYDAWPADTS
jgi:hypothetical protein